MDPFMLLGVLVGVIIFHLTKYGALALIKRHNAAKEITAKEPDWREDPASCPMFVTRLYEKELVEAGGIKENEMSVCDRDNCPECGQQKRKTRRMAIVGKATEPEYTYCDGLTVQPDREPYGIEDPLAAEAVLFHQRHREPRKQYRYSDDSLSTVPRAAGIKESWSDWIDVYDPDTQALLGQFRLSGRGTVETKNAQPGVTRAIRQGMSRERAMLLAGMYDHCTPEKILDRGVSYDEIRAYLGVTRLIMGKPIKQYSMVRNATEPRGETYVIEDDNGVVGKFYSDAGVGPAPKWKHNWHIRTADHAPPC